MHFEGRLCQQNSRIPVFVRKLFVYFVIRKEIEHKNVKRQVLELLSANGSLKKSQPIRRQMRFDCLQNFEIWLLFQGLAATHNAICEWWVEFFIAAQFVKNLRQRFQPSVWSISAAPPPSFSMLNVVRRSVNDAREKVDASRLQHKISRADPTLNGRGWVRLMVRNVRYKEGYWTSQRQISSAGASVGKRTAKKISTQTTQTTSVLRRVSLHLHKELLRSIIKAHWLDALIPPHIVLERVERAQVVYSAAFLRLLCLLRIFRIFCVFY